MSTSRRATTSKRSSSTPTIAPSLLALESIYADAKDAAALLDIIRRRAESAENDAERTALLYKQARLSDESLGDPRGAVTVYEQIVEASLEPEAVSALERLYTTTSVGTISSRSTNASSVSRVSPTSARRSSTSSSDRSSTSGSTSGAGVDEYKSALDLDPQHAPTVAALEALLLDRGHAARAAEMLEAVYLARLDWRRVMATLDARLGVSEIRTSAASCSAASRSSMKSRKKTTGRRSRRRRSFSPRTSPTRRRGRSSNDSRASRAPRRDSPRFSRRSSTRCSRTSQPPRNCRSAPARLFEAKNDVESALKFFRRAYAFDPRRRRARSRRSIACCARRIALVIASALYKEALDFRNDPKER